MTLKNFVNKRHAQHAGWVLGVPISNRLLMTAVAEEILKELEKEWEKK